MGTRFTALVAPPQTLDSLDAWGGVDDFPLSLDDARSVAAGIYAVSISDPGASSNDDVIVNMALVLHCAAQAASSESIRVNNVYGLTCSGKAVSESSCVLNKTAQPEATEQAAGRSEATFNLAVDAILSSFGASGQTIAIGTNKSLFIHPVVAEGAATGMLAGHQVLKSLWTLEAWATAEGRASVSAKSWLDLTEAVCSSMEQASLSGVIPLEISGCSASLTGDIAIGRNCGLALSTRAQSSGKLVFGPKYGSGWALIPQKETDWSAANG